MSRPFAEPQDDNDLHRLCVEIHGAVQGVGFRPFVFRLATELRLAGWVINDTAGVFIEVEGTGPALAEFLRRLPAEQPPQARIQSLDAAWRTPAGYAGFEIRHSASQGRKTAPVLPDIAACPDCLREVFDAADRRHGYPFTNCTNCGPRFSIIQALPYDRPNTTMRRFFMCPACQAEYDSPTDRRFHAQPNACPVCGPRLALIDGRSTDEGAPVRDHLLAAADALRAGQIVAVKGLGGFHLMVDAGNAAAVERLRRGKPRRDKPLALMARDLDAARRLVVVDEQAAALLSSAEAPIVLLPRRADAPAAPNIAPDNPTLGVMLAYTPLHHLLLDALARPLARSETGQSEERKMETGQSDGGLARSETGQSEERKMETGQSGGGLARSETGQSEERLARSETGQSEERLAWSETGQSDWGGAGAGRSIEAVAATSGNLSDEPICIDEHEAVQRLAGIADLFLVHDRPIERHVDDSVAWIVEGAPRLLRRARGYAPLPVLLAQPAPTILAVGAHLKNSVALSVGRQVFISQHIGDLETAEALAAFERVIADFLRLYEATPTAIAHDMHPDYLSTRWAQANDEASMDPGDPPGRRTRPAAARQPAPLIPVQHHHAHLAACLAENGASGPALGVTWDGTGYGLDGTIWGGEFLLGDAADFVRAAHLRSFRLPGGDAAVKEPRRAALALLWELYGEASLDMEELPPIRALPVGERRVLGQMLQRGLNTPSTTSAGRLFDGVAALLGLHQQVSFEGQAAMALEFAAEAGEEGAYPVLVGAQGNSAELSGTPGFPGLPPRSPDPPLLLDWRPLIEALVHDLRAGVSSGIMAARFHNALVDGIAQVAMAVGQPQVALTGGCFQNRLLLERSARRLRQAGFAVLLHRQVPPNDGGISLGQVAVAAARLADGR